MEKKKSVRRIVLTLLAVFLAAVAVAAIIFKLYALDYYKADVDSISSIKSSVGEGVASFSDEDFTVFVPGSEPEAVVVFYPGGKVEFSAYSGLMYELADRGYLCVLPRMPENLAFLRIDAVDMMKERYPDRYEPLDKLDWFLAGHSLGGVAASQYLAGHLEKREFAGLILCASYTTSDFSNSDLRLLSIYGSEDKVINMENYEANKVNWPADSLEYVIQGGIHSYFGNYGIQEGDGTPGITNDEQIKETADVIEKFIEKK